ncbi:single-stranded-DNA-specific exonuclease RecJ [Methanococcus maripaludis]|uniref:DHH family phosphoesterase n=1 Tax=Methanococcus maripaludis TaxID=39152 RepID=A0A8T3W996_METMI|nr:DHH family phosphoesterase [Methanococcus maripaludis]MBG0769770.1 DHH family phosphoesterase [Methanococcus maripaludis]
MDILPIEDISKFNQITGKIKEKIENCDGLIRIVTHHDPDGLTAGSIMLKTLLRLNKNVQMTILEHLSKESVEELSKENDKMFIFCDMGSGQINLINNLQFNAVILDHHPPEVAETEIGNILQLNPHLFGANGAKEISASGVCYLIARLFEYYDLATVAVVGAIGDMQHLPFIGLNKYILNEARKYRYLSVIKDIVYNCYNLPISRSIYYSTQPYIRELDSIDKIKEILEELSINPEKKGITVAEKENLLEYFKCFNKNDDLIVDRYEINHKLNDAFYLSEVLNACGRKEMTSVGIGILLGDDECIRQGENLYKEYKDELIEELKNVKLTSMDNIEYFIGEKGKTGIISALMVKDKPVLGFNEQGEIYKVSSRGSKELVECGLNLSKAMAVSKEFGGDGGGHNIASGAAIQKNYLNEFLEKVNEIVGEQLKK